MKLNIKWIEFLSIIISCPIIASGYGCQSSLVCTKLNRPVCIQNSIIPCGCFDLVKASGGFAGVAYDPRDEGIREAIVVRQDSTVEFYRNDTLFWRSSFQIAKREVFERGKLSTELELINHFEPPNMKFFITVQDPDHLCYGPRNVKDWNYFTYVRHK
jgi:hypothetical protein